MQTTQHTVPDRLLLERYFDAEDESAFTELARRHLPLVRSAAMRLTENRVLAEDASQKVFGRLARLGVAPPVNLPLPVWLHRAARSAAIDLIRAESRRRRREETFAASRSMDSGVFPREGISPVLDDVIDRLPAGERGLILRRFFSGESHAVIAAGLGLSEDAARMRVNRALERLRTLLERRGIRTTAAALALGLPAHAATSGPAAAPAALTLPAFIPAALMTFKAAILCTAALLILTGGGVVLLHSPGSVSAGEVSAPPQTVFFPARKDRDAAKPGRPAAGHGNQKERNSGTVAENSLMDRALASLLRGEDPAEPLSMLHRFAATEGLHRQWFFWRKFFDGFARTGSIEERFVLLFRMMRAMDDAGLHVTGIEGQTLHSAAVGAFLDKFVAARALNDEMPSVLNFVDAQRRKGPPPGAAGPGWSEYLGVWEGTLRGTAFLNRSIHPESIGTADHMKQARAEARHLDAAAREAFDETLLLSLALFDGEAAIKYLLHDARIANPSKEMVGSMLVDYFLNDPAALSALVRDAPPGPARDQASAFLVRRLHQSDPAAAAAWRNEIRSPIVQQQAAGLLKPGSGKRPLQGKE